LNNAIVQQNNKTRNRRLSFSGVRNFRDLGGYKTVDGRTVRWGLLYRSDGLHKLTDADLISLSALGLHQIVDFRSQFEKERETDRLSDELSMRVVEIPILDNSTEKFRGSRKELVQNLKKIDAAEFMLHANVEFASRFTPEIRQFIDVLLSSEGRPILFHCTAGKDRTGFAAAILLRLLGVPHDVVMEDYLLTNQYFYTSHRWNLVLLRFLRGKQFTNTIRGFMLAKHEYLSAAFETIDRTHGSFEYYVRNGLGLAESDIECLKSYYLE
jgi:protein-tyrosine phosphatase